MTTTGVCRLLTITLSSLVCAVPTMGRVWGLAGADQLTELKTGECPFPRYVRFVRIGGAQFGGAGTRVDEERAL
jgi:hypothetical protein